MCNRLHDNAVKIPESGIGYKIFRTTQEGMTETTGDDVLHPMCCVGNYNVNKWMHWKSAESIDIGGWRRFGDGFCFFLTERGATKLLDEWCDECEPCKEGYVIKKIQYKGGLGKHKETMMIDKYSPVISLCKKFKIIE